MFVPLPLTDEQTDLLDTTRRLLSAEADVRRSIDAGYDRRLWARLAEIGLHGLTIPDRFGGAELGAAETFIVFREMGRVLLRSPYFATAALATNLLLRAGTADAQAEYLPRISSGELRASVAVCEQTGSWDPALVQMSTPHGGAEVQLTGQKYFVVDAADAELLLVLARSPFGLTVYAVGATDTTRHELVTVDLTRPLSNVVLDGAPARRVSPDSDCTTAVSAALASTTLALIAEQIGGAERVMEMALDYAKTRVQFGRPIGGFQAIKHKLADMALDTERMLSAGWGVVAAQASLRRDAPVTLSLAKAFCSEAFFRLAAENIQIHGGIGYTWEHPAHLYFRRAKSSELILGSPADHRELMMQALIAG